LAKEKESIIWLRPGAGEILLGLNSSENPATTRYCIVGNVSNSKNDDAFGVGVWFDIRVVQELTLGIPNHVTQSWAIKPTTCLIPWNLIAYVQRGAKSPAQSVGFVRVTDKKKPTK
jgi:hypothetical protein